MTRASKIPAEGPDEPGRDRAAVLDRAINEILKQYGDGAVMRLGEATHLAGGGIPPGSLALDLALGGGVGVVVVDSVAALVPRAEIEGDMGDATMGMQARLMSQALRKLSGAIKQTNTAVVFTNQLRQRIGGMFGNPETTTGGMALKFYASVRIDVRRVESIKLGQEVVGNRVRARVVKNKVASPFKVAEFDIMYNEGISKAGGILDLGVEAGLVEKRGSFYTYGEGRIGQGRENAKQYLRENPQMALQLEEGIRAAFAAAAVA